MASTTHGPALGWAAAIGSAAAFGSSGAFAKPLLDAGWSSAALVALRIGLAALVLLPPALLAMRGRWGALRAQLPWLLTYGLFAGAAVQVAFFNAVQHVPVAIALLMEYLGVIWVVVWGWVRRGRRPTNLTLAGMAIALAGLVVIIDPFGSATLSPVGLAWGFVAGLGLAVYYVVSAEHEGLPPVAFVSFGLGIGALGLLAAGLAGLMPWATATGSVRLLGASVPWWLPAAELVLVAAAAAYFLGFLGAQFLGSTPASFVGLTEVVFAVVWAWLVLAELPGPGQLLGGLVLLGGVALVRWASSRSDEVVPHDDLLASGADADA